MSAVCASPTKGDEKPWQKNLKNVMNQVDKMNRHYKETDINQWNQFEEFASRHKSDEWVEGYHRRLVKNEMKIEEMDSLGPLAQQKIKVLEEELERKREITHTMLSAQALDGDQENQDFWGQVTDSPITKHE
jgi:hypothetical protein